MMAVNPYGISDRVDAITQQTFYRLAAPFYQSAARDDIIVVLLTEPGIRNLQERGLFRANIWPIAYRDHAYILDRIMEQGPKSLLIDVYFDRQRSTDNTLEMLRARLERGIREHDVDVFHAAGFGDADPTPIQKMLSATGSRPVITGWEALGEGYPLQSVLGPSATYAIYESYCLRSVPAAACDVPRLSPYDVPVYDSPDSPGEGLSVYWGSDPPPPLFAEDTTGACERGPIGWWAALRELGGNLVIGLVGLDASQPQVACPYHRFITADYLATVLRAGTEGEKARIHELLHNKIVLYGVKFEGAVDTVDSPVHGRIPAVFLHAMALDNLMNFGDRYVRAGVSYAGVISIFAWLVLVTVYAWGLRWLERKTGGTGCFPVGEEKAGQNPPVEKDGAQRPRQGGTLVNLIRRHPKWFMSLGVGIAVVLFALLMFVVGRLEPVNSIAFLGLLAMLGILRGSKLEASVLNKFGLKNINNLNETTPKEECRHESSDTR
ncbi:MAG TPA: CHASE2 domain-containing protein [Gammaproteobacteria bacterium]